MLKDKNKIKKDSAKLLDSKRSHFEQPNENKFFSPKDNTKTIDPDVKEILKIESKYRDAYQNKFKTSEKSSYSTYESYSS